MKGYKTLLFALAVAVAGVLQTFDWATVIPQDKTWSGVVMLMIGAIVAGLRYVTDTPVGKKVIVFLLLPSGAALLLVAGPAARAADVSGPAAINKALSYQYPSTRCGLYYGVNTLGSTGAVENAQVGTQVAQGAIGLTLGYTCPIGAGYWFADGMFDFANLNGNNNGFSVTGPAVFEQRFGFGAPIDLIMNMIPGLSSLKNAVPSLIPLPSGIAVVTSNPYLFGAVHEEDVGASLGLSSNKEWLVSAGFGIGNKTRLSNGVVFDPFAEYILPSSHMCFGPVGTGCTRVGARVAVGMSLEF